MLSLHIGTHYCSSLIQWGVASYEWLTSKKRVHKQVCMILTTPLPQLIQPACIATCVAAGCSCHALRSPQLLYSYPRSDIRFLCGSGAVISSQTYLLFPHIPTSYALSLVSVYRFSIGRNSDTSSSDCISLSRRPAERSKQRPSPPSPLTLH